jgi:hypothetical protein
LLGVHAASPPTRLHVAGEELGEVIKPFRKLGKEESKVSRVKSAAEDLRDINKTLRRLEAQGVGLADAAQGLRRVSNVLGVALEALVEHEKRMAALDNDLGDTLLRVEKLEVLRGMAPMSKGEAREYLRDAKEIREEDKKVG